jgi:hypothetical protein
MQDVSRYDRRKQNLTPAANVTPDKVDAYLADLKDSARLVRCRSSYGQQPMVALGMKPAKLPRD